MTINRLEPTEENIERLLSVLGDTSDKVYASLRRRRIRGNHRPAECPIAIYLKRRLLLGSNPNDDFISVGPATVEVFKGEMHTVVYFSDAIRDFIDKFDSGNHYQFLAD